MDLRAKKAIIPLLKIIGFCVYAVLTYYFFGWFMWAGPLINKFVFLMTSLLSLVGMISIFSKPKIILTHLIIFLLFFIPSIFLLLKI